MQRFAPIMNQRPSPFHSMHTSVSEPQNGTAERQATISIVLKWVIHTAHHPRSRVSVVDLRSWPVTMSCVPVGKMGCWEPISRAWELGLTLYFLCSCPLRISKYVQDLLCNPTHSILSSWSPSHLKLLSHLLTNLLKAHHHFHTVVKWLFFLKKNTESIT